VAGVTKPHVLRFTRDSNGGVLLSSKRLSRDETWEEHGVLLTVANLKTLVATRPTYVPLAPLDCDKLVGMLDSCAEDGILPEGVQEKWKEFLEFEESLTADACSVCRDLRAKIASTTIVQRDKEGDPAAKKEKAARNAAFRKQLMAHADSALFSSAHPRVTDWELPEIAPAFARWGRSGTDSDASGSTSKSESASSSESVSASGSGSSESSEPPADSESPREDVVVVARSPPRLTIGSKKIPKKKPDVPVVVGRFVAMYNGNIEPMGTPNGVWLALVKEEPKDHDGELLVMVDWFVHTAKDRSGLSGTWKRQNPRKVELTDMKACLHAGFKLTAGGCLTKKDQATIAGHPLMLEFACRRGQ
jgi:hypothetical protein